jgi:predicted DNA-binding protein
MTKLGHILWPVLSEMIREMVSMAPRKKPRTIKPGDSREYKIRLPEDVAQRIEAKAKAEGRPQNRVIINELARFPDIEPQATLAERVRDLEVVLAHYGSRITWLDLSENLLNAVDALLAAEGGPVSAAIDKLRVARAGMLAHQRADKRTK